MNTFERMIEKFPDLSETAATFYAAVEMLEICYRQGGKVMVCGNGGSASDSEHIVGELMKGFNSKRPVPVEFRDQLLALNPESGAYLADHLQGALPAISLVSQTSLITAYLNDVDGNMVFAQQVYGYGKAGDVLIAISASGNAQNVINAIQVARALGVKTVGLTGRMGGLMGNQCDVAICVPWDSIPDIQERHLAVYHALCAILEERFFA